MQDRSDGALRVLIVDDRSTDARAWADAAAVVDRRLKVHCVASAARLQAAVLEGGWAGILCRQVPERLSVSAVLSMTQVLAPPAPVLLFPDVRSAIDRRRWLSALIARSAPAASAAPPDFDLDLGPPHDDSGLDGPVAFGGTATGPVDALRESEERFRTLTEIAPVGIFLTDADQACVYVNERWSEITGIANADAMGRDWRLCLQTQGATLQATSLFAADPMMPLTFENPIERPGGSRWVIGQMRPYRDSEGSIIGHLGVITDITDRKNAELALRESEQRLRDLSTHLTSSEERQREQIAREIHDDIGSSLTGMKIDLLRVRQLTTAIPEVQEKIAAFNRLLDSTAAASVRIAKALRPSILDDGIVPAIEWQLREFSKRMDIDTEFAEPEREPQLTPDQSIALFRVVQEALNNVAKHAQARHVDVVLFTRPDELTLEIHDDGKGLPKGPSGERIERRGAFGISGMRERIASLGGWMDITGAPGEGTTVMVGIPMQAASAER